MEKTSMKGPYFSKIEHRNRYFSKIFDFKQF